MPDETNPEVEPAERERVGYAELEEDIRYGIIGVSEITDEDEIRELTFTPELGSDLSDLPYINMQTSEKGRPNLEIEFSIQGSVITFYPDQPITTVGMRPRGGESMMIKDFGLFLPSNELEIDLANQVSIGDKKVRTVILCTGPESKQRRLEKVKEDRRRREEYEE